MPDREERERAIERAARMARARPVFLRRQSDADGLPAPLRRVRRENSVTHATLDTHSDLL